jgi:hypothetical protein
MINLYKHEKVKKFIEKTENPSYEDTHMDLNSRTLIVGGSGTGKTNALVNYIMLSPNTFQHIIICNRSVEEPLYQCLKDQLDKKGKITFFTVATLPELNALAETRESKSDQYLVVFDDLIADLDDRKYQKKLINYFTIGRKVGLTMIFLSQSYYKVPKTIRLQLNYLMLLRLSSNADLKAILSDFALGVSKDQLVEMYRAATDSAMNCLKIDINTTEPSMKFGRNFTDQFFIENVINNDGSDEAIITPGAWFRRKPENKRKRQN